MARYRRILLSAVMLVALLPAVPAQAAGSCDELHDTLYLMGAKLNATQYSGRLNGTRASLTARDPQLCSQGETNRYSLAWVGMTNFKDGLIQIGYWKYRGPEGALVMKFFAEWFFCGPSPQCDHKQSWKTVGVGTLSDDTTYSYRLLRDVSGTGKVDMLICTPGTTTCSNVMQAGDPYGTGGWGDAARVFDAGETQNLLTDMPGTDPQRADFASMQAFIADGPWQGYDFAFCAYVALVNCDQGVPGRYHEVWHDNPPRDHLQIWTDPT